VPVAAGMPMPIEPPMFDSQSYGAAERVGAKKPRPVVTASSTTIAFSGNRAASEAPRFSVVIAPAAGFGGEPSVTGAAVERAPSSSTRASSAAQIFVRPGEDMPDGVGRREQARLVGIGEERHRHL